MHNTLQSKKKKKKKNCNNSLWYKWNNAFQATLYRNNWAASHHTGLDTFCIMVQNLYV